MGELDSTFLYMKRSVLVGLFLVCCGICTWILFAYGPTEWSIARRMIGGVVLGAWCWLCLFINRIFIST